MVTDISPSTKAVGFWSAALATVFSLTYVVGQTAEWMGLMGSGGGAHNASTPLGLVVLLTPSLFLGPSFLLLVLSIHQWASPERRIWSHAAVAFATVYTVLISINYYVQLAWVAPRLAAGRTQGLEVFLFTPFDSFLYAVDILGYSFMSLATLFAARVFMGAGLERVVRMFLTANGLLLPFIALQMYVHGLIWIAALWALTFPGATWSLAVLFRRAGDVGVARDEAPLRKALLVCGILSSLLYIAMSIVVAMQWKGYSSASQTISELSAIGAPTRSLWVLPAVVYTSLVAAFGWGVWKSADRIRVLRVVGPLIVAYGALGVVWPFAPMHLREVLAAGGGTLSDTMHIVLASVTVLLMLLAIGFGAAAFGTRFRLYSVASLVILVAFGALTFLDAPLLAANLPTPWLGVWERINIGVFLIWVVVLATALLRASPRATISDRRDRLAA